MNWLPEIICGLVGGFSFIKLVFLLTERGSGHPLLDLMEMPDYVARVFFYLVIFVGAFLVYGGIRWW